MNKNDQAVIEAQSLEKRIQNVHEYITLIKPQKGELENQENKNKKPAKITQRQRENKNKPNCTKNDRALMFFVGSKL